MDFNILPVVMIALCVLMMVLMMRGMHHGRPAFSRLAMGCCGFGFGSLSTPEQNCISGPE